ncbi:MAG: hypothetical protein HYU64_14255 [Armatimonadetes bacterium]|nr:hypothetical protein [Armatimonadota bacterium]
MAAQREVFYRVCLLFVPSRYMIIHSNSSNNRFQVAKTAKAPSDPAEGSGLESFGRKDVRDWTVLMYLNGINNLGPTVNDALLKVLDNTHHRSKAHVAAQASYWGSQGLTVGRYVCRQPLPPYSSAEEEENLGGVSLAEPQVLRDFLTWGIESFPAKHHIVIFKGQWAQGAPG